ncbi:MAG: glycosyltransferase family 2 protein [Desulfovibrionaceae bacterium]|nr:glycosyltransferase family 2 protein [Desulfovibrionaceae bacterium]
MNCSKFWNDTFTSLPGGIARRMLMGSSGLVHLGELAEELLTLVAEQGQRALLPLGSRLLLAAYESDPLNASFAAQVEAVEKVSPFVPTVMPPLLKWLISHYREPENLRYLMRLLERRETDKTLSYLETQLEKEPDNIFWLHHAVSFGIMENRTDWLLEQLQRHDASEHALPAPLSDWLRGCAAYAQANTETAERLFARAAQALPLPGWQEQRAQCLFILGEDAAAAELLRSIARKRPWRINTLLRLYDLESGRSRRTAEPEGRGVILFYTWNKASLLEQALAAVCENERYGADVIVLDNGSTDDTPQILNAWKARMGKAFHIITLPVNVGAPAARNWLAALPQARCSDWLAYMDDDALVPPDWLGRFGAAMQAYPQAGIYGCKVVDMHTNMTMQSVDFHLLPAEGGMDDANSIERKFQVSALQLQCFNFGQFDYMRPCASVTGCCHLFRRELFDRVGGFDLRYSPSQYDDLEHDLRAAMKNELPVYQGHISVRHVKRTGKAAQVNPSQMSNAMGNLMKLHMRYSRNEFEQVMANDAQAALQDLQTKLAELGL